METSVITVNIILVLIILIPLYFAMRPKKVNLSKVKSLFSEHSQDNLFNFNIHLTDKRKVLGIDAQKKGLLFIDFNFEEPKVNFVDFQAVKNCKLITQTAPEDTKNFKKVTFHFETPSAPATVKEISFYDANHPYTIPVYGNEEYLIAQEWNDAIRKLL